MTDTKPDRRDVPGDPVAAGQAALERGAWTEARSWFAQALEEGAQPEALEGVSWAAWWQEDVTACLDAREHAYRLYRAAGDRRGAARMALWLGDDHVEFRAARAVGAGWLARAGRLLDELDACPEHGWLAVFEAHSALDRGDASEGRRLAGQAQDEGRRHGLVDLQMFALATEGAARIRQGDVAAGMRCLDESTAAALSGEYENLVPAAWSCCLMLSSCEQVGDYERGAEWCEQIAEFSRRMNARFLRGVCRTHYGSIQERQGYWDDAESELVAALDESMSNRPAWRADALVRLGWLRRRQGRLADAAGLFDEAPQHPLALLGLAAVSLDRDEPAIARDLLERALRQIPSSSAASRGDALELLVRTEIALGDVERAGAWLEELRTVAATADTELLRAAVSASVGLLAAAVGDHAQARDHLEDALDRFAGAGAPLEAARARLDLARALHALDRSEAARRDAHAARTSLAALGAAVELARADALLAELTEHSAHHPDDGPLTPRQVEVLRLVAEGCSDQAIASTLVISEHTVHRHVANIYARLGCSSRAAAVARAGRLGLL